MKNFRLTLRAVAAIALLLFFPLSAVGAEVSAADWTVQLWAETKLEPASITLKWAPNAHTTEYEIHRKRQNESTWVKRAAIPGSSAGFEDSDVKVGEAWEYKVVRRTNEDYTGYGYIYAGIDVPLQDERGRVILVVANDITAALAFELRRLESDLVGDGWRIVRRDVSPSAPVTEVKEIIRAAWAEDKINTRSVFLFGRVPIPYSGDITPDFHPNHKGAWPADVYYGEMDGPWTDSTVDTKAAEREVNWNFPGDGKFDQSEIPSPVELETGRVDLRDLTCFANKVPSMSELDLLRQYLNKDHNFRHGITKVERRAFIVDYIGIKAGQDPVGTALRNFSPFFGPQNIKYDWFYFPSLNVDSYLCSWVGAGGSYHYAFGLGSADEFAISDPKVVFTMWLGSYYGDWNHESNFMRASLGSKTHVLTASYSGAPHYMYHHMALGETIGYGVRISQNNVPAGVYPPEAQGINQVHISLLGDPTLRLHPVIPPRSIQAVAESNAVAITWESSTDVDLRGYHVYRSKTGEQNFQRLTTQPIGALQFQDTPPPGSYSYMVRAVKLEKSASGTYENSSQGAFAEVSLPGPAPASPAGLQVVGTSGDSVTLRWTDPTPAVEVQRSTDQQTWATIYHGSRAGQHVDRNVTPGATYQYRARVRTETATSPYTSVISTTVLKTPQASAMFVTEDVNTRGLWEGNYGSDGWNFGHLGQKRPSYFQFANFGASEIFTTLVTNMPGALGNPNAEEQLLSGWWDTEPITLDLNVTDQRIHRLSVYFHDFDNYARRQRVELLDAVTGAVLDTRIIEDFSLGKYLCWDVQGRLHLRITSLTSATALVNAVFLDTPANLPKISPLPGSYSGGVPIILTSTSEGSELRYTTNGSDPTMSSPLYTKPFVLGSTGVVKVRAFTGGQAVSGIGSASFLIGEQMGGLGFVQEDAATQGAWSPTYGQEGFFMPGANWSLPISMDIIANGGMIFVWNDNTRSDRALARIAGSADRVASAWYANDRFSVRIALGDEEMHRVAFYFLDWDRTARIQEIKITDASGATIENRTIQNFEEGKYLVYDLKGTVNIEVRKITGNNVVLNGVFIGPAPKAGGGGIVPLLLDPHWNTGFGATLMGVGGTEFVVESSEDCVTWTPLLTDKFANEPYLLRDVQAPAGGRRFYRVRAQ